MAAPGRQVGPSGTMPPPPAPAGKVAMLEREANALSSCFKASAGSITFECYFHLEQNAVIKTGQIYAFHADARRL